MIRRPDWLAELGRYLDAVRDRPFSWGQHDCALFAAGAVAAMTGQEDIGGAWRGTYNGPDEALAQLQAHGIADHVDLVGRHLVELPRPLDAQVGDVVAVIEGNQLCLGICGGAVIHVAGPRGLGAVDLMRGVRAWRV